MVTRLLLPILMIMVILVGCESHTENRVDKLSAEEGIQILNSADRITVEENIFSLAKSYSIIVDGKEVATVKGNVVNMFGDKFVMKDIDDNVIVEEKEIKRFGRLNRSAEIKDSEGAIIGYIGEETVTKFTSIGYYFHFFNKDKEQIGVSDQVNLSILKKNKFMDNDGNVDYKVSKNFDIINSYDIEVISKDNIPLYFAILMVCIEDAISSADE